MAPAEHKVAGAFEADQHSLGGHALGIDCQGMGLREAPPLSGEAAAATRVGGFGPRRVAAAAASSRRGAGAPVGGSAED